MGSLNRQSAVSTWSGSTLVDDGFSRPVETPAAPALRLDVNREDSHRASLELRSELGSVWIDRHGQIRSYRESRRYQEAAYE